MKSVIGKVLLKKPTAPATYRGVANWVSNVVGRKLSFKSIARRVVMTKLANAEGISIHDAAKHVGVVPQILAVYHQKGKKVKTQAAMLLSRYNVENPKDENEIKAEPCPKRAVKAEPCQPPAKEAVAMKVEPNSPPIFAPREASVLTISDEDLLSSHSADVLNVSVDSSLRDEEDDYEEFPPTQLSERGDVFTSLEEGHNAYREAAFAAPPS